jgi:hypothetical protein
MDILDQIRQVAMTVSDREMTRLILEEELLFSLVTKSDIPLSIKRKAYARIALINELQLKAVGHK